MKELPAEISQEAVIKLMPQTCISGEEGGGAILSTQDVVFKKVPIVRIPFINERSVSTSYQEEDMSAESNYSKENSKQPGSSFTLSLK